LLHFANLMAAAMAAKKSLGCEMFDAWTSQNAEDLLNGTNYPVPVILWRAGQCRAFQGQKTAKNFYDDAAKLLLETPRNLTVFSEGLLVEADRFATLNESNSSKLLRKIQADYQKFSELPLPPTMRKAFSEWEKIDNAAKKLSADDLKDFFQRLVNKIPVI